VGAKSARDDRIFKCPRCGRGVNSDCPHLPFCSERCRMIDFGTWLEGGFRINGEYRDNIKVDE
jgi:hypothetical protein